MQGYADAKAELTKGKDEAYYCGYATAIQNVQKTLFNILSVNIPDDLEYEVIDNEKANP